MRYLILAILFITSFRVDAQVDLREIIPDSTQYMIPVTDSLIAGEYWQKYLELNPTPIFRKTDSICFLLFTSGGIDTVCVIDSFNVDSDTDVDSMKLINKTIHLWEDAVHLTTDLSPLTDSTVLPKSRFVFTDPATGYLTTDALWDDSITLRSGVKQLLYIDVMGNLFGGEGNFDGNIGSFNFGNGINNYNSNTTGNYNFGNGSTNFFLNEMGQFNFGNGLSNFYDNVSGEFNFGNGRENFRNSISSSYNFGNGYRNFYVSTASYNFGSGLQNFHANTNGAYNFGTGYQNFYNGTTGAYNFGAGYRNFYNIPGSYNFGVGSQNHFTATSGNYNFGSGLKAFFLATSATNTFGHGNEVAVAATDLSALNVVAIGNQALRNSTSLDDIIALGFKSGFNNIYTNVALFGRNVEASDANQAAFSDEYLTLKAHNYIWNIDQDTTGLDGYVQTYNGSTNQIELQEVSQIDTDSQNIHLNMATAEIWLSRSSDTIELHYPWAYSHDTSHAALGGVANELQTQIFREGVVVIGDNGGSGTTPNPQGWLSVRTPGHTGEIAEFYNVSGSTLGNYISIKNDNMEWALGNNDLTTRFRLTNFSGPDAKYPFTIDTFAQDGALQVLGDTIRMGGYPNTKIDPVGADFRLWGTSDITGTMISIDPDSLTLADSIGSDADWFQVGADIPPQDISDTIYTMGKVVIGADTTTSFLGSVLPTLAIHSGVFPLEIISNVPKTVRMRDLDDSLSWDIIQQGTQFYFRNVDSKVGQETSGEYIMMYEGYGDVNPIITINEAGDGEVSFQNDLITDNYLPTRNDYHSDSIKSMYYPDYTGHVRMGHIDSLAKALGVLGTIPQVLDDLDDVVETTITTDNLLQWDGANWVNVTPDDVETDMGGPFVTDADATSITSGHVAYSNGTTLVGSANHFWDNATARLGIGTATPARKLDINTTTVGDGLSAGAAFIGNFASTLAAFAHKDFAATITTDYAFMNSNTGITYINAKTSQPIYFRQNNVNKMTLDAAGEFGIGTSSPARLLHVAGSVRITGSVGTATTLLGRDASGDMSAISMGTGMSLSGNVLNSSNSTISLTGDVTGSGTTSIATTIATGVVGQNEIGINGVGSSEIADNAVGATEIAAGAVGASELASYGLGAGSCTNCNVTIDADGRISTYSTGSGGADDLGFTPGVENIVYGGTGVNGDSENAFWYDESQNSLNVDLVKIDGRTGSQSITSTQSLSFTASSGTLNFGSSSTTNISDDAFIGANGNDQLEIQTSATLGVYLAHELMMDASPGSGDSYIQLDDDGDIIIRADDAAGNDISITADDVITLTAPGEVQTPAGTEVWIGFTSNNSTAILEVAGSAYKSDGSTLWTNTSDKRVKEQINDLQDAYGKISSLRPVSFHYNKQWRDRTNMADSIQYGYIAQEYQRVFPSDVREGINLFPNESPLLEMSPNAVMPHTVAAVQQLIKDKEALEAIVSRQEDRLLAIEKRLAELDRIKPAGLQIQEEKEGIKIQIDINKQ